MKYSELIGEIARTVDISQRQASDALLTLRDVILGEVRSGGEVHIPEVGRFTTIQRAERQARHPQTGEPITVPAHRAVKFRPASALKQAARG